MECYGWVGWIFGVGFEVGGEVVDFLEDFVVVYGDGIEVVFFVGVVVWSEGVEGLNGFYNVLLGVFW